MSSLSVDVIGFMCLVLFGLFYWLAIFATVRAILAFVGTCLIGTAGFFGRILGDVATWAAHLANSATSWAVGVTAGAVALTVVLAVIFIHDLMPKHTAGKRTGWAGVALALLLVTGVSGIASANSIPGTVRTGVTNVKTTFSGR